MKRSIGSRRIGGRRIGSRRTGNTPFNGQNKEGQAWCQYCHSLDHCSNGCPQRPRPPKSIKLAEPKPKPTTSIIAEICNNYNSKRGCKFAKFCRRLHKWSGCGGAHPRSCCPSSMQVLSRKFSSGCRKFTAGTVPPKTVLGCCISSPPVTT